MAIEVWGPHDPSHMRAVHRWREHGTVTVAWYTRSAALHRHCGRTGRSEVTPGSSLERFVLKNMPLQCVTTRRAEDAGLEHEASVVVEDFRHRYAGLVTDRRKAVKRRHRRMEPEPDAVAHMRTGIREVFAR